MHSPTLPPLDAAWSQGLVTAHSRVPRQRSKPTRKSSLGRRLSSARPGGQAVGFPVARHLVWGRGGRARSRRIWRPTGTAPATGSLGLTGPPASLLGHRGCAAGNGGDDTCNSRLKNLVGRATTQCWSTPRQWTRSGGDCSGKIGSKRGGDFAMRRTRDTEEPSGVVVRRAGLWCAKPRRGAGTALCVLYDTCRQLDRGSNRAMARPIAPHSRVLFAGRVSRDSFPGGGRKMRQERPSRSHPRQSGLTPHGWW